MNEVILQNKENNFKDMEDELIKKENKISYRIKFYYIFTFIVSFIVVIFILNLKKSTVIDSYFISNYLNNWMTRPIYDVKLK